MLDDIKNEFDFLKEYFLCILSYNLNYPFVKPERVNFDITNRCPLKCKMCNIWKTEKNPEKELTLEELKELIDQVAEWGIKYVSFAGGETLLRKSDVLDLINYAKSKDLFVALITSGCFLDKKTCKQLINSGLDKLTLSLDGAKKQTHDFIRGTELFEKVNEASETLVKLRQKLKSKIELEFATVVTSYNYDELIDIFNFMNSVGFDYINYQAVVPDNSFQKEDLSIYERDFWPTKKEIKKLEKICEKLVRFKERTGKIRNSKRYLRLISDYFRLKEKFKPDRCLAGFKVMNIDAFGNVTLCWFDPGLNVRNKNLRDIWKSEEYKNSRIKIKHCKIPCMMLCHEKLNLRSLYRSWMDARLGERLSEIKRKD